MALRGFYLINLIRSFTAEKGSQDIGTVCCRVVPSFHRIAVENIQSWWPSAVHPSPTRFLAQTRLACPSMLKTVVFFPPGWRSRWLSQCGP